MFHAHTLRFSFLPTLLFMLLFSGCDEDVAEDHKRDVVEAGGVGANNLSGADHTSESNSSENHFSENNPSENSGISEIDDVAEDSAEECAEKYFFVRIDDLVTFASGEHPGADIDGIKLTKDGEDYFPAEAMAYEPSGADLNPENSADTATPSLRLNSLFATQRFP